jgi:hypothetical protein
MVARIDWIQNIMIGQTVSKYTKITLLLKYGHFKLCILLTLLVNICMHGSIFCVLIWILRAHTTLVWPGGNCM